MNTESFRGLRAKMPIIDDCCLATLDEIYEIIFKNGSSITIKEKTIKIVGETLCIE